MILFQSELRTSTDRMNGHYSEMLVVLRPDCLSDLLVVSRGAHGEGRLLIWLLGQVGILRDLRGQAGHINV